MQFSEMIVLFQKLDTIKGMLVAEVIKLVKLILVMPATNAVGERSFSSLKRIKTYLQNLSSLNNIKQSVKPSLNFAYP